MQPRGIRSNNPFNLRPGVPWQGLADPPDDGAYCRFVSPVMGIRAGAKDLHTKNTKDGLLTVRAIIAKFAPPDDANDTAAYVAAVSGELGVSPDRTLNLSDPGLLAAFTRAIIRHENGQMPYSNSTITQAVDMALQPEA